MKAREGDLIAGNPYKHDQIECESCGHIHRNAKHIYKQHFSVAEGGELMFKDGLKCVKCGKNESFIFRDRRAMKILDEYMKRFTHLSERDRILAAMDDFRRLHRFDD